MLCSYCNKPAIDFKFEIIQYKSGRNEKPYKVWYKGKFKHEKESPKKIGDLVWYNKDGFYRSGRLIPGLGKDGADVLLDDKMTELEGLQITEGAWAAAKTFLGWKAPTMSILEYIRKSISMKTSVATIRCQNMT